jgi:amicyanin
MGHRDRGGQQARPSQRVPGGTFDVTRIRSIATASALGLALVLSACGNGPPDLGNAVPGAATVGTAGTNLGTATVKVDATADLKFNPNASKLKAGDVIQWTNSGSVPHNVTFDSDQSLTSQTLQQGDTWQVKFTTAGTYAYHCTFHPGMDGQITVGG